MWYWSTKSAPVFNAHIVEQRQRVAVLTKVTIEELEIHLSGVGNATILRGLTQSLRREKRILQTLLEDTELSPLYQDGA